MTQGSRWSIKNKGRIRMKASSQCPDGCDKSRIQVQSVGKVSDEG
jgi:hypothetical protein